MSTLRHSLATSLAALLVLALFLKISAAQTSSTVEVQIEVDGPWMYAVDPDNASQALLIAPQYSNHETPMLQYGEPKQPTIVPIPFRSQLTISNLVKTQAHCAGGCQPALLYTASMTSGAMSGALKDPQSYVIVLPKPAYGSSAVQASARISPVWWTQPGANTTAQLFTNTLLLHYVVSKNDGFVFNKQKLAFPSDSTIHVSIISKGDTTDPCDPEARAAFKDLVGLFALKLYIDLPSTGTTDDPVYSPACWKNDPQNPGAGKPSSSDALEIFPALHRYVQSPSAQTRAAAKADLSDLAEKFKKAPAGQITGEAQKALAELQQTVSAQPKTPAPSSAQLTQDLMLAVNAVAFHAGGGACRDPVLCGSISSGSGGTVNACF